MFLSISRGHSLGSFIVVLQCAPLHRQKGAINHGNGAIVNESGAWFGKCLHCTAIKVSRRTATRHWGASVVRDTARRCMPSGDRKRWRQHPRGRKKNPPTEPCASNCGVCVQCAAAALCLDRCTGQNRHCSACYKARVAMNKPLETGGGGLDAGLDAGGRAGCPLLQLVRFPDNPTVPS